MKVRDINKKDLQQIAKINLKRLNQLKAQGYSKEQCYSRFTKVFVDKNY